MGVSKMINEQVVVKGGVRGFVDPETGVWLPIGEAEPVIRGQGGRPLNSTRPQRNPSTSTSTPEPTPEPKQSTGMSNIPPQEGMINNPDFGKPGSVSEPEEPKPTTTSDLKILRNKDGTVATKYSKNSAGDTPMQQWAKNFPKLAAKVKPGKAGYKEIRSVSNPATAATGGVNPRLGTYAMMQQANMNNLMSNYGRSKQPILPVSQRTMKKEAYDVVLDYLLSEGHVDTVEEAHYVMLQMTSEHVQEVVEERTAADPKMKARMGHSNPAINGKPVPYPKGHPEEGKPMSFNKAETDGVNMYRRASEKAGRKIYADEPLPKK